MSELFYFHVGFEGAKRDFPRSLARRLTVQEVQPYFQRDLGTGKGRSLAAALTAQFPDGFNCWGIPSGGQQVFGLLEPNDIVLLIGKIQLEPYPDGVFGYAGRVKIKPNEPLHWTSQYVWTEPRFPLMFFFDALEISLPWPTFLGDVGYRMNMDPHGRGARVNPQRYKGLPGGDPDAYLHHILQQYP